MTHAELSSTSEPGAGNAGYKKHSLRPLALIASAGSLCLATLAMTASSPASADQISDAKAQAAAISAKIASIDAQREQITGQVTQADYQLSQLGAQIAAGQAQIAKDQAKVNTDTSQLRGEAISDYVSSGTTNQVTQMFTSNVNTSGIRSEYSTIATGNVTDTIDHLHTAQAQLQATQTTLVQHQAQQTATRNSLVSAEDQASSLANQYQSTLDSVNANIQKLVAQQQAEQAAAAKAAQVAAFNAKVAASQRQQQEQASADAVANTTSTSGGGGGGGGGGSGGGGALPSAPPALAPGAAGAVQAALSMVGVPYVWGGASPAGFDCSGLVMWAYAQVGISLPHFSGAQYDDTTHIPLSDIEPGDLLFYGPGGDEHVAMYVGGGSMVEAPYTGASVWVTGVRTGGDFAGVGRVV
jgi:peptidoglycan DL-endopeptidase CwlO